MFEWIVNFIAAGLWQAMLFLFLFTFILGGTFNVILHKKPIYARILYWMFGIVATIIVFSIQGRFKLMVFLIIFLFFLMIIDLIKFVFFKNMKKNEMDYDRLLVSIVRGFNDSYPRDISANVRCEGATALQGKIFVVNYTVKSIDVNRITQESLIDLKRDKLEGVKKDIGLALVRKYNIDIWLKYMDLQGNEIFTLKYTPNDYQ